MKKLLKLFFLATVLLSGFVTYAQPGSGDGGGTLEGGDPQPAPINSKLLFLAIAGVCFVIYYFRRNKKIV